MKPTDLAPAPFQRPIEVESLSAARPKPFDLVADAEARAEIAAFLGLPRLDALRMKGEINAAGRDRWRLTARLTAELCQTCVVSLSDVSESIDEDIVRDFIPAEDVSALEGTDLDLADEDDPDPYERVIDPGIVAIECLALALDPYPRAPGAEVTVSAVAAPGVAPLKDDDLKPFAGLAALKDKMTRGG
ncbi:MAG: YceD family protein [Pseudomonadota bacterium]